MLSVGLGTRRTSWIGLKCSQPFSTSWMNPWTFYLLHVFDSKVSRFTAMQMIHSSTSEYFTQNKPEVLSFNTAVLVVPSEPDQNPEHQ